MKSKLFFLDLAIFSLWMLSMFGGRHNWNYIVFPFIGLEVMYRLVLSFTLYHKEKRSWLPLLIFVPLMVLSMVVGIYNGIGDIIERAFEITKLEHNVAMKYALGGFLMLWIFVIPYIWYLVLLFKNQLANTDLTWKELLGGVLWHGRLEKTCSAIMMTMLVVFLTGLSMNARLEQIMCVTTVPLTYWLLCHYLRIKADGLWVLVVSMTIFWYAQIFAGVWRATMLLMSFGLVVYVISRLYKNTRNNLLSNAFALYLGILFPSFAIGYNQYACINYARMGFYYLEPFRGILYITDVTGELYGLRDRYGLLVEPEYEQIRESDGFSQVWTYIYELRKDGYSRYYDVLNNRFIHEPDIHPELQQKVREILENHFRKNGSEYNDKGQITVTELWSGRTIADVSISMYGNPYINYDHKLFIPDDNENVSPGEFYRNDSVKVSYGIKCSTSYALHIPNDSLSRHRINVRLVTDSFPADSTLVELAEKVADLSELKL